MKNEQSKGAEKLVKSSTSPRPSSKERENRIQRLAYLCPRF